MLGGIAAEAFDGSGAGSVTMRGFATLLTARGLFTKFAGVSKSLAGEAPEWVGNKDADLIAYVTGEQCVWEACGVERDHQQAGVSALSVTEGSQTSDM